MRRMKFLLTIADETSLDIYAVQGTLIQKHWYLDSKETITYDELCLELSEQISWSESEWKDVVCLLNPDAQQDIRTYVGETLVVNINELPAALGHNERKVLIETGKRFLVMDESGCRTVSKTDIYDGPVTSLVCAADRKFREIGCRQLLEGTESYANTRSFFMNLVEHMPKAFEVIAVPVFASSASEVLTSDRGFVELHWAEYAGEGTLGQSFDDSLFESLSQYVADCDLVWIYNEYLKEKLFR